MPYAPITPPIWPEGPRSRGELLGRLWVQRWVTYRNRALGDRPSDPQADDGDAAERQIFDETLGRAIFSVLLWNPPYPATSVLKAHGAAFPRRLRKFFDSVVQVTPDSPARRRTLKAMAACEAEYGKQDLFFSLFGEIKAPTGLAPLETDQADSSGLLQAGWSRMRLHDDDRVALARWAGATPGVLRAWSASGSVASGQPARSGNAMDDLSLFLSWAVLRTPNETAGTLTVPEASAIPREYRMAFTKTPEKAIDRIWGPHIMEQARAEHERHNAATTVGSCRELIQFYPPPARLVSLTIARGHTSEGFFLIDPVQGWAVWRALVRGICERPAGTEQDTPSVRFRLSAALMADEVVPNLYPDWIHGAAAVPDSFVRETDRMVDEPSVANERWISVADLRTISRALVAGRDKIALKNRVEAIAPEDRASENRPTAGTGEDTPGGAKRRMI